MLAPAPSRPFWVAAAARTAAGVNFSAWLERFLPVSFVVASVSACMLYALRRLHGSLSWGWLGLALGLLAGAGFAWWRSRKAFFSRKDAQVFLEFQLKLNAQLSAAEAGLVAWPAAPDTLPTLLQWRARSSLGWLVAGLGLCAAGLLLPVPDTEPSTSAVVEKPPALVETETWLHELAKMEAVNPASVETLASQARELSSRPTEEQYSHSALEAADTLRDQTATAARDLARALEAAAGSLAPLADPQNAMSDAELGALSAQLSNALQGARDGKLGANSELLKQLGAAAANLHSLSPEQAAMLCNGLSNGSRGLRGISGAGGSGTHVSGLSDGRFSWKSKDGPGSGGPGGGGPPAPLSFNLQASQSGQGALQTLSGTNLENPALGDKVGEERGAHVVDPSKADAQTVAGAVAQPASGGDAVWVNRLTPTERAALKNFFK